MKRILFVDDEQLVLGGLRDMLRRQRKNWDMTFALGGAAALDELARAHFDVIVSDMRMPGIDGVSLLRTVKERHPATARVILSGHADRAAVFNALPVAHQFLSKPCDTEALRDVIERACALNELLPDTQIRHLISGLHQLPSTPQLHRELIQAVDYPDLGLDELAAIIEQDPTMAAKVLQLVNSSFFGLARRQTCVWEAVSYLGTELLKDLTLHAGVFDSMTLLPLEGFSLEDVQRHSLMSARIAQRLMTDKARQSEAYAAALLHDIGKIVLALIAPERYAAVLRDCRATRRDDHVVELEQLGVSHAEVGAYLLALWGLPLTLVEAVAHHHYPERAAASDIAVAVHAASAFSQSDDLMNAADVTLGGRLNVAYIADTRFGRELARWRGEAVAERQRACGEG